MATGPAAHPPGEPGRFRNSPPPGDRGRGHPRSRAGSRPCLPGRDRPGRAAPVLRPFLLAPLGSRLPDPPAGRRPPRRNAPVSPGPSRLPPANVACPQRGRTGRHRRGGRRLGRRLAPCGTGGRRGAPGRNDPPPHASALDAVPGRRRSVPRVRCRGRHRVPRGPVPPRGVSRRRPRGRRGHRRDDRDRFRGGTQALDHRRLPRPARSPVARDVLRRRGDRRTGRPVPLPAGIGRAPRNPPPVRSHLVRRRLPRAPLEPQEMLRPHLSPGNRHPGKPRASPHVGGPVRPLGGGPRYGTTPAPPARRAGGRLVAGRKVPRPAAARGTRRPGTPGDSRRGNSRPGPGDTPREEDHGLLHPALDRCGNLLHRRPCRRELPALPGRRGDGRRAHDPVPGGVRLPAIAPGSRQAPGRGTGTSTGGRDNDVRLEPGRGHRPGSPVRPHPAGGIVPPGTVSRGVSPLPGRYPVADGNLGGARRRRGIRRCPPAGVRPRAGRHRSPVSAARGAETPFPRLPPG